MDGANMNTSIPKPMILRPEQLAVVVEIVETKSHMCAAKTGAGKTVMGVEAVLRSGAQITLVCAPLNTLSGWRKTFERQTQGAAVFSQISSTKAGKQAFQNITDGVPGVYFVGTEFFRRLAWRKIHIDFMIVDEGHRFQNARSANFEVLKQTVKVEYKLYLSATPAGNRIEGLWAGSHWLWPTTYKFFWPWVTQWMKSEMQEHDGKKTKKVLGERNPGAVWESLPSKSKFAASYKVEPDVHIIEVELTPAQRKVYERFEEEAVVWLEENPLIAKIPAVKQLRLREMLLAVPSIKQDWIRVQDKETKEWSKEWGDVVYYKEDAKSSKLDALFDLLSDLYVQEPTPVLIVCHSRKFVEIVVKRLQAKGYNARQFIGGMSPDEREWKKSRFGHEFDILVATIPTVSEGTDGLQLVCHNEVWFSVSDNRVQNIQTKGRLPREGQTETVQRYYIRAANTIETKQISRLETDQALLDESLEADNEMELAA